MKKTTDELLTVEELVARWKGKVAAGTLKNWRYQGRGPAFTRAGIVPMYPLSAVVDYEMKNYFLGLPVTGKQTAGRKRKVNT